MANYPTTSTDFGETGFHRGSNLSESVANGAYSAAATTITVNDATNWATANALVFNDNTNELMFCTSRTGNDLTVVRAYGTTSAAAITDGDTIRIVWGADPLELAQEELEAVIKVLKGELAGNLDIDGSVTATSVNTDTISEETGAAGVTIDGVLLKDGLVDSRDVATDGTKLDGIEALADVTDATNVAAAGAVMDSDAAGTYAGHLHRTGAGAYEALKSNLNASTAPTSTDDSASDYAVGSLWIDTTNDVVYVAMDVTASAAVWQEVGAGSGLDINSLTEDAAPTSGDFFVFYDTTEGVNNKVDFDDLNTAFGGTGMTSFTAAGDTGGGQTIADTNTLTIAGGEGIVTADSVTDTVTIDLDINSLTADGTPNGALDYVATWDASAGAHKKVLLDDLPGGGGGGTTLGSTTGNLIFPAVAFVSPVDAGALRAQVDGTNYDYYQIAFDATTDENAGVAFTVPQDWNGGAIDATIGWKDGGTTANDAVWVLEWDRVQANSAPDAAFTTAATITSTASTTIDAIVEATAASITQPASLAAGDLVYLNLRRDADAGGDTLAIDAEALYVRLEYTRTYAVTAPGSVVISPGAMTIPVDGGATQVTVDGTNYDYTYIAYDAATDENAGSLIVIPEEWDGGAIDVELQWADGGTTANDVVWVVEMDRVEAGSAPDAAFTTAATITSTADTVADELVLATSAGITLPASLAPGELVYVNIRRDADVAGDTLAVDAELYMVRLKYTRAASGVFDINSLTEDAAPTSGDFFAFYDTTEGINNKVDYDDLAAVFGGGVTWNNVTGTSQTMVAGNAYIANNAALCTLTLPSVASTSVGDFIQVQGAGAGGWKIAQVALSQIIWNEGGVDGTDETTIGTGGSADSTDDRDGISIVCTFDDGTNTEWTVTASKGNISLT